MFESGRQEFPVAGHGVEAFFTDGRLTAVPRKPARRAELLAHLTKTLFEDGREYTEREVNDTIRTVHEDCSALRRYLVEGGYLARTKDGSSYHRTYEAH
ncbi:DUF2087 domain-containing protein [Streptomyces sp. NPDC051561]|uniref:DUF2087 domain-containing protein n=1 Tax=Streptomyces sp. NPDC051561 TaxID=3365658 RepID=UPI0037ADD93A